MNMGAGHGGSSGRYARLEEIAFEFAVVLDVLGMNNQATVEDEVKPSGKVEP